MPSDPIPIANISKEVIIEESFLSQIAQEAKVEVEPEVVNKVEDKSTSIPIDELVSALRFFGKPLKSDTVGKLREAEPFMGKDPKKLKPFLFQCRLYFWGLSDFDDDIKKVTFALSYLQDVAQEWYFLASPILICCGLTTGMLLWTNSRPTLVLLMNQLILNTILPISE